MRWLILSTPLLALIVTACGPSGTAEHAVPTATEQAANAPTQSAPPARQTLHFVGPYDLTLVLATEDNFETATLTDNSDTTLLMHSVPAASGIRLEGPEGRVIHFKGDTGYVQYGSAEPIDIAIFRPSLP